MSSVMEDVGIGIKVLLPREVTALWGDRCQMALFEAMTELSSAKLCITAKGEFYPGTTERVVLISGTLDQCRQAIKLFVSLLSSSSPSRWDPAAIDISAPLDQTSYMVLRVTVPRAAGGTILGRQGSHVRAMQDVTGARLHASDKKDVVLRDERMLTVAGSAEACHQCLGLVLKRLAELRVDPDNPFLAFLSPEAERGQAPRKGNLVERTTSTDCEDQALVGGTVARPTSPTTSTTSSTVSDVTTCPEREGAAQPSSSSSDSSSSAAVAASGPSDGMFCHAQRRKGRGPGFDPHCHSNSSSSSSSSSSSNFRGNCTGVGSGAEPWANGNGANSRQLSYPPLASYSPQYTASPHYGAYGHPGGDHGAYYGQAAYCQVPGPGSHYPVSYSPHYSSWAPVDAHAGGHHQYQHRQMMMHQPRQNQYQQYQYQIRSAPPTHSYSSSSSSSSSSHQQQHQQQQPPQPLQSQQQGQQKQGQHIVISPRNRSGAVAATADIDDRVYTVTTIHMSVPDELMGAVFGKCGASLKEIQHVSQANVVVSSRGEYEPGTMNRRVTISGSPTNARHALLLIQKRIEAQPSADTNLSPSNAGLCARPALPVDASVFIDDDKTTDEGGEVRAESSDSDDGDNERQSKRPPLDLSSSQPTSRREAKV